MAGKKNIVAKLSGMAEAIEGVGLTDFKAWKKKHSDLGRLLKHLPDDQPEAAMLCARACDGLKQIGAQGVPAPLTAVDAILEALGLVEKILAGETVAAGSIRQSENELMKLMLEGAPPEDVFTCSGAEPGPSPHRLQTLDDAAAFIVQLEPANPSGVGALQLFLQDLIAKGSYPQTCLQWLAQAAAVLETLAGGPVGKDIAPGLVERLGEMLEHAIIARDFPDESDQPEPPQPTPASAPPTAAETADHMPGNPDRDLMREFIAESTDLIAAAEEALLSLETDPEDIEAMGKVFRAFHTVKGTAAFLELNLIADLGHHAETLLSRVRDGEIRYGGGYADLTLRALDMIRDLVDRVQQALKGAPLLKPDGYDLLVDVLVNPSAAGVSEDFDDQVPLRVGDILVAQGKAERGRVENAVQFHPGQKMGLAMVKSKAASLTDVGQALRAQKRMRGTGALMDPSLRVSTQRLDRLMDMIGELVIAHSMVAQDRLVAQSDHTDLANKVNRAGKIVRELQDISMSMRMVPLKGTFTKMARVARDVGRKVGKKINFRIEGEDTEIDRHLVDIINDPLVHMVRNAVDHGIESPEERIEAGKPAAGEIKLSAYHSAGCVVVAIQDDGRGLDRGRILAKARQKGLIPDGPDFDEQRLSDREVNQMIFEPGFSTARTVTDVSGRGVGMDVVKRNLEALRGQAEITSEAGRGSVFKLRLPLTLAIIDGMVVRVANETYVIPTVSITRAVKPKPQDISTVLHQGEMLLLQGSLVPLLRPARIFRLAGACADLWDATIVVVEDDGRQVGLVVDDLVGRQQVVIKSLGETMRNIRGISGGAIMPDGRVGLIVDVGGFIKFAASGSGDVGDREPDHARRTPIAARWAGEANPHCARHGLLPAPSQ